MPVAGGPFIQKTGILLEVDAANAASYPGTGTTLTNIFSPGTYNGTITGSVTFNSLDVKGALVFPANNSYVDFGNIGNISSSWAFQIAVNPAPSGSDAYTILSYTSGSSTSPLTFKLDYSSSTQLAVLSAYSATGSAQVVHKISGSVATGSWSIINASYGGSVLNMYVNGRPADFTVTTGSFVGYSTNNKLILGGTNLITSSYYSGSVSNLLVYNQDVPNTRILQNYNAFATRVGLPPSNLFVYASDPDAFRFAEIANITDSIQVTALSNLVVGLKGAGLWDKMLAIYPFVGGTAYSHKWNLKDPSDTDAAYRILWNGTITHNSKGAAFDGNSYGDTRFAPFTALTNASQSSHISVYISGSGGSFTAAGNTAYAGSSGLGAHFSAYNTMAAFSDISIVTSGTKGLAVATRTDFSSSAAYIRGTVTRTSTSTAGAVANPRRGNIFIGKENGDWPGMNLQTFFGFASLGTGLTTPDVENLYTVVQAYNTSLNRAFNQ